MSSATNVLAVCLSWATLHPLQYIYISPVGMIPSYNFVVANALDVSESSGIELFYLILIAVSADDFLIRSISNIWIFVTVISFKMIKRIFQIVQMMVEFYFYIGSWKNNSQLLKFYNRSTIFRFFCFENLFLKKLIFSITRILLERGYYITVRISWNNTKILLNFISIHLGQEGDSK